MPGSRVRVPPLLSASSGLRRRLLLLLGLLCAPVPAAGLGRQPPGAEISAAIGARPNLLAVNQYNGIDAMVAQHGSRLPCTADTTRGQWLVSELLDQALATDSASTGYWRSLGLPRPAPEASDLERDPAACNRVLRAFYREEGQAGPFVPGAAVVVRVGEGWIVMDPSHRAGEWVSVLTFNHALDVVSAQLR